MIHLLAAALTLAPLGATPPKGFTALFNGKDLAGWHGLNPHAVAKLKDDKLKAGLAKQREDFAKFWKVESGELVNGGEGPYATTDADYGDIELLIEIGRAHV